MFKTVEDLILLDNTSLSALLIRFKPDELAIALHGFSPSLRDKMVSCMDKPMRVLLENSAYKNNPVRLVDVEAVHAKIVAMANQPQA